MAEDEKTAATSPKDGPTKPADASTTPADGPTKPVEAAPKPADAPPKPADAPPKPTDAPAAVTRALTNAFLALKSTQDRIEQVIAARCEGNAQRSDMENMLQDANERALGTKALADCVENLRPWVSRIAQNIVVDHFRRQAVQAKWMKAGVDVEELPPDPVNAPDDEVDVADVAMFEAAANDAAPQPDPAWTIGAWVEAEIAKRKEPHRSRDAQLYEMLRYKAAHPKLSDTDLAATFSLTRDKYKHRLALFKARYVPLRKRYTNRRNTILVLLVLVVIVVVLAARAWRRHGPRITADPDAKPLVATPPSASAPPRPAPDRFNQAAPTEPPPSAPPGKFGPR